MMKPKIPFIVAASAVLLMSAPALVKAEPVSLRGKNVAILIGQGFHDGETLVPAFQLRQHGATVTMIGIREEALTAYNSDVTIPIKTTLADVDVSDFHALILPGGRGPANLRTDHNVVRFVREFAATGRPIAAICHGPQVLASAGVLRNVSITGVSGIRAEMEEHGATFVNREVEIDGQFITSRLPRDLPAFTEAIVNALAASGEN